MMERGILVGKLKETSCLQPWQETTGSSHGLPAVANTSAASLGKPYILTPDMAAMHVMMQCGSHAPVRVQESFILGPCLIVQCFLVLFHRTAQASCLVDEPRQIGQYKYPEQLPGQLYDADTQCKWQFGSKAKLCNLDFVKVPDTDRHIRYWVA